MNGHKPWFSNGVKNRRETMVVMDEWSQTVVQHWVSGTHVKQ